MPLLFHLGLRRNCAYLLHLPTSGSEKKGVWLLALALLLHYYNNYILALANLPVLIPLSWALYKQKKSSALYVVKAAAIIFLGAMPWLIYARPWYQLRALGGQNLIDKALFYLREFHFHFIPLIVLILPVVGIFAAKRFSDSKARKMVKDACGAQLPSPNTPFEKQLYWLMPLYFGMIIIPPGPELRYLLPLLPVACVLSAVWVFRYVRWRQLAVILIFVQCTTNILAIAPTCFFKTGHKMRWTLREYVQGITHPYTDRFAGVLDFLNKEARPGQSIFVFDPEFPLVFYTSLKIIDARFLRSRGISILPDWILTKCASCDVEMGYFSLGELKPYYEEVVIRVKDSRRNGNIPEPDLYQYRTAQSLSPFILYKKKTG